MKREDGALSFICHNSISFLVKGNHTPQFQCIPKYTALLYIFEGNKSICQFLFDITCITIWISLFISKR